MAPTYCLAKDALELLIFFLLLPLENWGSRCVRSWLFYVVLVNDLRASCILGSFSPTWAAPQPSSSSQEFSNSILSSWPEPFFVTYPLPLRTSVDYKETLSLLEGIQQKFPLSKTLSIFISNNSHNCMLLSGGWGWVTILGIRNLKRK